MPATASFPIYVTALVNVIVRKDQKWTATGNQLMSRGTPVSATLRLRSDVILVGASDGLFDSLRKIGV